MRNVIIAACLAASFLSTPAFAKDDPNKLGKGDYYITTFAGFDLSETPARVTTIDFDVLQRFDNHCRTTLKPLMPSMIKSVLLVALRNAPGAALFGGLGASLGGFTNSVVSAKDYAVYNGLATVGGSIGAGINAHEGAKHAAIAGCMMSQLNMAQRYGALKHIIIVYNVDPAYGRTLKRDKLAAPTEDELVRAGQKQRSNNDQADTPAADEQNTPPPPPQ